MRHSAGRLHIYMPALDTERVGWADGWQGGNMEEHMQIILQFPKDSTYSHIIVADKAPHKHFKRKRAEGTLERMWQR